MRVILTVGCPGSGKTTWARQQNMMVISRDDIRRSLYGDDYVHKPETEEFVTKIQHEQIAIAIKEDKDFIVADTNLNSKTEMYIKSFMKGDASKGPEGLIVPDIKIEHKVFHADWPTLVERNKRRGKEYVPMDVLRGMYKRYLKRFGPYHSYSYKPNTGNPKAVIFDIDGTLAIRDKRSPYDLTQCLSDKVDPHVYELYELHKNAGYKILILSGRHQGTKEDPTCYLELTTEWLKQNNIIYDELFLRAPSDYRKDDVVKEELFRKELSDKYYVKLAIDDRDRVVELWRRLGIKTLQVDFGDF